jgi:hypothetical protein
VQKNIEKGFVRIKGRNHENSYFDSKVLDKKECDKIIKNFKNDINENKKFLELSLVSGVDVLIMMPELEYVMYIPEKIVNKEKNV